MGDLLAGNSLLLLFVVIGVGYLIGNMRIFGFSLGVAAVLFAGMAFGAADPRLVLPEFVYVIGLVLFVYAIGLQAGPGFFASFRKRGLRASIITVALILGAAALALLLARFMKLSGPAVAGLFCGSLTNTPALAATIESIHTFSSKFTPDEMNLMLSAPVVAYGLAYPFGVFGVIFWFHLFARIFKIDFAKEEKERASQFGVEAILSKTYKIINPALEGQSVEKVLRSFGRTGFVLSRIKKGDAVEVVGPGTILNQGDHIVVVGTERSQEIARILFGEEAPQHVEERRDGMSYRRIFVSSKEVIGKTIDQLRYEHPFQGAITRLRRGDVEIVPGPETILERGDRILVVSRRERADEIAAIFGDSIKSISEADFLSLSLGIVLGVLVGMIPIPLGGGMTFKLGFAGGPLVVGLILGRMERTGPIIWGMPFNANLVVRQIGLVFFLAAIGTRAGTGFAATFQSGGVSIILAGALITTGVTCAAILLGYRYLKLPFSAVMGMMSGIQTQPACLAYSNERANNEMPNTWYATVYPAAMIAKIILAQVIVSVLLALIM